MGTGRTDLGKGEAEMKAHTHSRKLSKFELAQHIIRDHPEHIYPVGKELLRWKAEELVTCHSELHGRTTKCVTS